MERVILEYNPEQGTLHNNPITAAGPEYPICSHGYWPVAEGERRYIDMIAEDVMDLRDGHKTPPSIKAVAKYVRAVVIGMREHWGVNIPVQSAQP